MKDKKLRPARYIGQTAQENRAKRRAQKGLPPLAPKPDKPQECDECGIYCSQTEYNYNGGLCAGCVVDN